MLKIDPTTTPPADLYQYLIGAVAPRPIAFVSTLDKLGVANLAPYSFYNAFSGNPPIVAFSAARRSGPQKEKDTLANVLETGELVINAVSWDIARQMTLASVEFAPETGEFIKAGFTKVPSEKVKPFRVGEAKIQLECRVEKVIPMLEDDNGVHLVVCRVLLIHIDESVLSETGRIDPYKADLVGRLGRHYYVRASGDAINEIIQPTKVTVIGFDGLPESIRTSKILNGNQISRLAALPVWPEISDIEQWRKGREIDLAALDIAALHQKLAVMLDQGDVEGAPMLAVWNLG